ncbi:hypothetical protein F4556_002365 [Kitasatospora gansuensis]|uniref:Uncharacterized protein n=1 Tax=Kitasatospora gansuensis TaxID=258050 RepID=A0A7W7WHK7_9ACTN|nr:hypothetical protein [Kitasatospora gansuensis]MBB4946830.1 hypothetical protein [Kitasatospora gansuensis]
MTRIETPVAGFTGDGPGGLHFVNGVAETDDDAIIGYCRGAGYIVGGQLTNPLAAVAPRTDPRHITVQRIGTPIRDAAVHPHQDDHLPPHGAGSADPHGPDVIAPGLFLSLVPAPQDNGDQAEQAEPQAPRPAVAAPVAEWRAYALTVADSDPAVHAEIDKATKAELIRTYGG